MTQVFGGFIGTLLVLEVLDRLTDMREVLYGIDATFVKVNLALVMAMGVTSRQNWGALSRGGAMAVLGCVVILDAVWAAYVAHKRRTSDGEKAGRP